MKEILAILNLVALCTLIYRLYTQKSVIHVHIHNTTHVDGEVNVTAKEAHINSKEQQNTMNNETHPKKS